MKQVYVQMAGVPGSGKSTIAAALGAELGAVILDHDVTKSALLASGVPELTAGAASYEAIKSLASNFLMQGHSVVLDSPCMYDELLQFGLELCNQMGANHRFVECVLTDMELLDSRLRSRISKPSQIGSLDQLFSHAGKDPQIARDLVSTWQSETRRPRTGYLQLETSAPLIDCVTKALSFVRLA